MATPQEPIIEPIVATPAVEPAVAPAAEPAPIVEAAPVAEPAPPQHPAEVPSLLETLAAPKPPESKAEEPKAEVKTEEPKVEAKAEEPKVETKAEEVKPPAEPEPPVEYKFEWSEHVKPQAEKVAAFTEFARENKLTPEAAQKAVSYFNDAAAAFVADQQRRAVEVWNETRAEWRKQILADSEIGGAGFNAAKGAIARMRDKFASDAQPGTKAYDSDMAALTEMMRITGVGDHPVFWKMLHRVAAVFDEPKAPSIIPQPTKNNGARPSNSLYAQRESRQ